MIEPRKDIDAEEFERLAAEYIIECEENKKEHATVKGVVKIKERNIADWKNFIGWWLVKKGFDFYTREHSYEVEKNDNHPLSYTIKKVKAMMDAYSGGVVANEGKGIFWAKNKLKWTDRSETTHKGEISPFNPFDINVPTNDSPNQNSTA